MYVNPFVELLLQVHKWTRKISYICERICKKGVVTEVHVFVEQCVHFEHPIDLAWVTKF